MNKTETIEYRGSATVGDIRYLASLDAGMSAPVFIQRDSYLDGVGFFALGSVQRDREGDHLILHAAEARSPQMTAWDFLDDALVRDAPDEIGMAHIDEISWNAAQQSFFHFCELARDVESGSIMLKIW